MLSVVLALIAQAGVFIIGLGISLLAGMFLGAHLSGPGGLLIATGVAGGGLLGAAVASQLLHDHLLERDLE